MPRRPTRTVRERSREEIKRRILEVALPLFQQKGFRATTMRDIADLAGIALGTTYNYFPTKEHLALYFFEQALDRVLARHRRECPPEAPLHEQVFSLIALELEEVAPYEEFLGVVVSLGTIPTSRLHPFSLDTQRLKSRQLDYVAGLLARAVERGEMPAVGFEAMLLSAYWVFHLGIVIYWLNDTSPNKEDTFVLLDRSLRYILASLCQGNALAAPGQEAG